MPFNLLRGGVLALAVVAISSVHAADSPGLFDSLGKLLAPTPTVRGKDGTSLRDINFRFRPARCSAMHSA